jgi:CelD/BcsL family acetyltransferase involved in cellulose biosynthesis
VEEQGVSHMPAVAGRDPEPAPQAPPTPGARLTVERKGDLDWRPDDASSLAAIFASRPSLAVFLSDAWLSGFFAEPPDGFEPSLVILREGITLRGVAPIAVRSTHGRVRVTLMGGGAGSDRTDMIAARGFEAACADAFLSWLGETFGRGFVLELRDVPAESALWGAVHRASAEGSLRLTVQPREVHTLPFLDLAEGWSSAPGTALRPRHPRSLDKHRRWLERRGSLRIERLEDPSEVMLGFDCLVRLLHARWGGDGGSALDDPRALRFHRHVLPLLLRENRLRMIRLSAALRPIAVFYGVASGAWWGYCLAGYDREWAGRIHLGQITLAAAIDLAVQEGATEFDFLKGAHRVKYLWPVRERATLDADVYAEGWGPQLARAAQATRETAAGLAKAVRGVFSRRRAPGARDAAHRN